MSRWLIEKSGTGIEKSGTGIEKSGTGIEKSGTGIEKSGTGIEKSGTGLRKAFLSFALVTSAFAANADSSQYAPEGFLQLAASGNSLKVSWIFDESVFSGIAPLNGSFANVVLTEISLYSDLTTSADTVGSGTGAKSVGSGTGMETVGSGTGIDTVGSGTGIDTVGSGTGIDTVGSGTGIDTVGSGTGIDTVGSGTGIDTVGSGTGIDTVGSGTGVDTVGSGTGADSMNEGSTLVLTVGSGTGSDSIAVTLPGGNGMQMEVALGCNSATVSILDSNFVEVVSFSDVPVFGASQFCGSGSRGPVGYENGYIAYNDAREPTLSFEDK